MSRGQRSSVRRRRLLTGVLAIYLAALGLSHLVRWRQRQAALTPSLARTEIASPIRLATEVPTRLPGESPVSVAYLHWPTNERQAPADAAPEDTTTEPPWVLLHGSPGAAEDFSKLAPLLAATHDVLAPDLPGFGASTRQVPDYSIKAHASYVAAWLEQIGVERAHLVGFSMGGGVALELAEGHPERMASITLLAAIGVQEYELFGNYALNHAVHGAQLAAIWLLTEATPHFGRLDQFMMNLPYARNFYDTDQRPLRGALERYSGPLLILHGTHDPLVPVEAAREHHRIVPQSELVELDTDHFTVFREPQQLAAPLIDFRTRVQAGQATVRSRAGAARTAQAELAFDSSSVPRATGITVLVWSVLLAVATLVSEDLTSISAGLLVAQGRLGFVVACLACCVGIFVGDLALFVAGRWLGRPWLRRRPLRWVLSPERIEASSEWLDRRGAVVIFLSRFTPGLRLPTYFAAGVLRTSFSKFMLYFAAAVAIWTPLLVGLSAWLGDRTTELVARLPVPAPVALGLLIVSLWLTLRLAHGLASYEGRRRLIGAFRRWTRWEFWPPWLFYPPVIVCIVGLALRHRSLTLFTAANPGFPDGGFVGESKGDILEQIPSAAVARYRRLPASLSADQRRAAIDAFLAEIDSPLPVVLKPDIGQRGLGVKIAHSAEEIDQYLAETARQQTVGELLVQEYIAGPELGVFYIRKPNEAHGTIFSITDKRLPVVVGDGKSTLEQLVRADPRANTIAKQYLETLGDARSQRLDAGAQRRLVEVGTHCRGAVFLDGKTFHTPELEAEIDRISREIPGFFFGRFDLKAPNEEGLRRGTDLRILELNGVTSEATHIYDPGTSLVEAYRVLFEQWRLAYEIGRQNRAAGTVPTPTGALLRKTADHLRSSPSV